MSEISRRALLAGAVAAPMAFTQETRPGIARIIDPHVHVWQHDPKFPFAEGSKPPARDASPEMLLDLMKANGVTRTVLIQVIHYKYDNSFVASVLGRYPKLFRAVCRVDPLDPAAPDHLAG